MGKFKYAAPKGDKYERRSREFLTETEVEKLMAVAEKEGRHGHRDATIIFCFFTASHYWDILKLINQLLL